MSKLKAVSVQYDTVLCNYIVLLRGMCGRTFSVCFINIQVPLDLSENF